MFAEVKSALDALKVTLDLVKGIQSLKTESEKNAAIINIQHAVLDAQQQLTEADAKYSESQQKIAKLKKKIADFQKWEKEKQRYELKEYPTGSFVYILKDSERGDDPIHRICTKCFEDGKKAILQVTHRIRNGEEVKCERCQSELTLIPSEPRQQQHRSWY